MEYGMNTDINVNYCYDCDIVDPHVSRQGSSLVCQSCGHQVATLKLSPMELIACKRLDRIISLTGHTNDHHTDLLPWYKRIF